MSIESFTQPYRLEPYNPEELKKAEAKKQKVYHVFQLYEKQLTELGIPIPMEMMDYELTTFKNNVDEALGIERKINTMVRVKDVDWLGDKKRKEFLVWYETWTGYRDEGKTGEPILVPYTVADFPRGLDKQHLSQPKKYDRAGNALAEEPGPHRWVHTIEFKPELIDQILKDTTDTGPDTIQFIVTGFRSYGGFSMEEFQNLPFEELEERGKTGKVGGRVVRRKGRQSDRGEESEDRN